MKKILIILTLFVSLAAFSQRPTPDFLWSDSIAVSGSDTLLVNNITGTTSANFKLINVDFNLTLGYLPGKSATKLVLFGKDTIPIVCLFQNYNYTDSLFCKWSNRTVNADTVELLPYRISEISYYATPLTGTNKTNAYAYFSVPDPTGAYFIDPVSGNDATGTGSLTNPWKTIIGVEAMTLTAGVQVYIKSGTEVFADRWTATKNRKWKGVGAVKVKSTNATYSVTCNNAGVEIENIFIDATGKNNGVYVVSGSSINKCYIKGGNYGFSHNGATLNISNCVTNGCAYSNYIAITVGSINITGCYNKPTVQSFSPFGTSTNISINYKYNKDTKAGGLKGSYGIVNIAFNELTNITTVSGSYTGTINIYRNIFTPTINCNVITSSAVHAERYSYNIHHNTFNIASGIKCSAISLIDQIRPVIDNNNIVVSGTTNTSGGIFINAISQDCHPATIRDNYFINHSPTSAYGIYLGNVNVGAGDDYLKNSIITGNKLIYNGAFDTINNAIHGCFITRQSGCIVKNNYIEGAAIGIVFRSTTQDNDFAECSYNVIVNCQDPLCAKGYKNTKFCNNTIVNYGDVWELGGCNIISNEGYSTGCEFRNNIFYDITPVQDVAGYKRLIYVERYNDTGFVSNNNILYSLNNPIGQIYQTQYTFNQWQALDFDTNSLNVDPKFNINYVPTNEIIRTIGLNLGPNYNSPLIPTATWPNPTTTTFTTSWNPGAFKMLNPPGLLIHNHSGRAMLLFYNNKFLVN